MRIVSFRNVTEGRALWLAAYGLHHLAAGAGWLLRHRRAHLFPARSA